MSDNSNKNRVFEIAAILAVAFLLWRLFRKKPSVNVEQTPVEDPFKGQPMQCDNIVYRPLSQWGPFPADMIGKDWCYRGDGSFFEGKDVSYGDAYADEQVQQWSEQKQTEAIRNINRKFIQFRLVNTGATAITTKTLDVTQDQTVFNPAPSTPVAASASGVTASAFTANWSASTNATGYYLDVATDSGFLSYVSGYQNKDVGNVTNYSVTGLSEGTNYYYRLRAYNTSSTSSNSSTITTETLTTYNDWFLPSKDELNKIYTELYLYGLGGYTTGAHSTSSEINATTVWRQYFFNGSQQSFTKDTAPTYPIPIRTFTDVVGAYAVRDVGPAGGYIFYISGTTYYEAGPEITGSSQNINWSNIISVAIGTTSTAIGEGQNNTNEIIAQAGHTNSAAKLCDDLSITH